jgi:hypothetical protein
MHTPRKYKQNETRYTPPDGSHLSQGRDHTYNPRYKTYWNVCRTAQSRTGTPLLQAGGHIMCPRGPREKFSCRVHQLLGLPVPFPTSA